MSKPSKTYSVKADVAAILSLAINATDTGDAEQQARSSWASLIDSSDIDIDIIEVEEIHDGGAS